MLELLLLRHAKSDWGQPDLADHDRGLAPRGLKAAKRMGRLLCSRGLAPDLALCSTAVRAQRTWEVAAAELGEMPPCRLLRSLYMATPAQMLAAIRRQSTSVGRLMLIGHDPGIHQLALQLAIGGEREDMAALQAKFPTAALAWLRLEAASWQDIEHGRLAGFFRPRDLDDQSSKKSTAPSSRS